MGEQDGAVTGAKQIMDGEAAKEMKMITAAGRAVDMKIMVEAQAGCIQADTMTFPGIRMTIWKTGLPIPKETEINTSETGTMITAPALMKAAEG